MIPPLPVLAFSLGPTEVAVIVLVLIILFGATRIPQLARSLGRAKGEYENARRESAGEPDAPTPAAPKRPRDG